MRRILGELALLTVGVALGIALIFTTSLRPINHETAWITWGYPFVWRSAASASPLYVYPLALFEDVAFWVALSLTFVEFPVRIVVLSVGLSQKRSRDFGRLLSVPGSSEQQRPPSRSSLVVASAIIIAAVLILASVVVAGEQITTTESLTTTDTITTTTHVTITVTGSSTSTVTTTSAAQTGQVTFYRTNGDWSFSLQLSSQVVPKGQPIDAYINVTNISGQTQRVHEVNPIVNPAIYSENGSYIWAWNPPGINFFSNVTAGSGTTGGPYVIPTSELSVGQSYILSIYPFVGTSATGNADYQIGESLMVNATISVT